MKVLRFWEIGYAIAAICVIIAGLLGFNIPVILCGMALGIMSELQTIQINQLKVHRLQLLITNGTTIPLSIKKTEESCEHLED